MRPVLSISFATTVRGRCLTNREDRDNVPMNFLADVKKVGGKERGKDRVLTADELRAFLAALADAKVKAAKVVRPGAPGHPIDRSAAERGRGDDAVRASQP